MREERVGVWRLAYRRIGVSAYRRGELHRARVCQIDD
jgi:hypothetical protein